MKCRHDSLTLLQIDLGQPIAIHGVGTLGHYQRDCFVLHYELHVTNDTQLTSFSPLFDVARGRDSARVSSRWDCVLFCIISGPFSM